MAETRAPIAHTARIRRSPHILIRWTDQGRVVQSVRHRGSAPATELVLDVLDRVPAWGTCGELSVALEVPFASLEPLIAGLRALDLVEVVPSGQPLPERAADGAWSAWPPAARLFHDATRDVPWARRPSAGRDAESAAPPPAVLPEPAGTQIPLPLPRLRGSLPHALASRRTWRRFSAQPLTLQDAGTLLGATFGVQAWAQAEGHSPLALKTSPSGGARHSIEAYCWARDVRGVPAGLYHYRGDRHALAPLQEQGPLPASVETWLPTQAAYDGAGLIVVMTSVLERVTWRYRNARGYRVVLIEAGHLGQTFCLTAASLGLAPFCSAALADTAIEQSLGVSAGEQPALYVVGAGVPAPGPWRPHADQSAPVITTTPTGHALETALSRRGGARQRPLRRRRVR